MAGGRRGCAPFQPSGRTPEAVRLTAMPARAASRHRSRIARDQASAAERDVASALEQVEPEIASALETADFEAAVEAAAKLGPVLHRFFEEVLVMAEDPRIRENRLRLLLDVRDTLRALGDLAQIPR